MYISLYDSLVDDDEDIRDKGAVITSHLLAAMSGSNESRGSTNLILIPPAARTKLLDFLCRHYKTSSALWIEAVRRVLGIRSIENAIYMEEISSGVLKLRSFSDLLLKMMREDSTTLFVEEKQNLYLDTVQEAETWLEVLLSLDHSAIQQGVLSELYTWVIEGIDALTNVTKRETDGPLGWTSNEEVFALGMRILRAAGALIEFSADGIIQTDRGFLRSRLSQLLDIGEASMLNPTWLQTIEHGLDLKAGLV